MRFNGTLLFLFLTVALMGMVVLVGNASAVSWHNEQLDSSDDVDSELIDWRTEQNDSKAVTGILVMAWYTEQADSKSVSITYVGWHIEQSDTSTTITVSVVGWHIEQNDSSTLPGIANATWFIEQSDGNVTVNISIAIWHTEQGDNYSDYYVIVSTLFLYSTPGTTVNVNETYTYYYSISTTNGPINVTMTGNATFLHCGEIKTYGTPVVPGNYTVSLRFNDGYDEIYQNFTLQVIGVEIPEPVEEQEWLFGIDVQELLIWGTICFIPVAVLAFFGIMVRGSRR